MTEQKVSENVMRMKMRPFLHAMKGLSPEFIPLLKTILSHVRYKRIENMTRADVSRDIQGYISKVYAEWKEAQNIIAHALTKRLENIKLLEDDKKQYHRLKNKREKERCISEIGIAKIEIRILQRSIDALIWQIFEYEHSTIRRLALHDDIDNLSLKNIKDSMGYVSEMNKDPLTIAVASDLTTFVHVGDVIRQNIKDGNQIIEIKSGEKNLAFSEAASFSINTRCPVFDDNFTGQMNTTDKKHFFRAKKQQERLSSVEQILETGEGHDNYHDKPVRIQDHNYIPDFFHELIIHSWKKLRLGKLWDIHVVDECLFIGVYENTKIGFVGFNTWKNTTKFKGIVFNVLDSGRMMFVRPFMCLNLPVDILEDIIDGKVIVVLCLDYERFFNYGNSIYPGIFKLENTDVDSDLLSSCMHVNKLPIYSLHGGNKVYMQTGMESRIVFDFQRPRNVIDWTFKTSDLKKDAARKMHSKVKKEKMKKQMKNKQSKKMRKANRNQK
ncbi:hypothetical protein Rahaq_5116 (plasmid) [Rahnella aceris]|uniref:Uncharacterized protein n=1 Tax=Rahnella sp. (strain Y9602) TaxID=2703885 RepID=A0A0H3FHL3_RAHSY|nr:hypothetical protein [Rahnella aceris]ADW76682.1 hypothetical protein Rahaq_5116 [Rahnella aceris]